ncbi:MAG: hypothetical protein R3362_02890 [Rhodothermales bacterium]|nr:hypothetical protein [Rhodothermales bacterium]
MPEPATTLALAAGMGVIAGMRSLSAPALVSRRLSQRRRRGRGWPARLLGSGRVADALTLLAAGEMIADKLPAIPARTEAGPLTGRAMTGALSGAAVAGWRGGSVVGGAVVGAAAALGAAVGAYRLRRAAGAYVPDPALALVEDAVVLAAGSRIASAVA